MLRSLAAQRSADLDRRSIWLFQDGSRNPFSGVVRGDPAKIEHNILLFRHYFPDGLVHEAAQNLGVALNFDRAERYAFEDRSDAACIFLEDDLVLSPHYIATLDRMLALALDDQRIGYVSACGDHRTTLDQQRRDPGRFIVMQGNWGFGLTRAQWLRNQPFVDQYLDLVRGVDYRLRRNRPIFDLYTQWGMQRAVSSQDRMKVIASCLTGGLRLNTTACLGQYIGRKGVHCTEAMFLRAGYDTTVVYPDGPFRLAALTDGDHARLLAAQAAKVAAVAPKLSPGQPVSFGRDGAGAKALRHGFYNPEADGAWSGSTRSELMFAIDAASWPSAARLDLELSHAAPGGDRMRVVCNDVPCGDIHVDRDPRSVGAMVPPEALRGMTAVTIRIEGAITGRREDGEPRSVRIKALTLHPT